MSECTARRGVVAFDRAGLDFLQRFVVPHLCFSKQSPALKGMKHRALTAQRLHCPVANEVFHLLASNLSAPNLFKTYFTTLSLRFLEDLDSGHGSLEFGA
jgi:hypothetical protein